MYVTRTEPMVITTTANRAFEKIFLDVIGPLPRFHHGNIFIITLQDDLIKFAWIVSLDNYEVNTVSYHFGTQFICLHSILQIIVTDCSIEFLKKAFKEV